MNAAAQLIGYIVSGIIALCFIYALLMMLIRHFANSSYVDYALDKICNRLATIEHKLENKEKE